MSAPNFRAKGIKSCVFCQHLGKYLTNNEFFCRKFSEVDFVVAANVAGQRPDGFRCDDFIDARKEVPYADSGNAEAEET